MLASFCFLRSSLFSRSSFLLLLQALLVMSKRASPAAPASSATKPNKALKGDDDVSVWASLDVDEPKTTDYKVVDAGPKTRVVKSFILNYKPKVEVNIALNGVHPELRFTSVNGSFTMTGSEWIKMTGAHLGTKPFDRVRLEATEEGFRLARYDQTSTGMSELNPKAVMDLNKYAAKRLKTKSHDISSHVCLIMASEDVTQAMFHCVADVYKSEYALLNSLRPMVDHFYEVARIVEVYVPPVVIVRAFLDKLNENKLVSSFNHYNLLATVLPQKDYLFELLIL